ncbi:MAG: alpha/beta hydrolase [Deltaproteobacteria bacterium]|nr:alpha/beta hydrolase [Deltaproteobacteria bacterium]
MNPRRRLLRRILLAFASVAIVPYSITVLAAALFYRNLLYPAPAQFPSDVPAGAELIEARASDGVNVRALMFRGQEGAPVAVYFHGNGETMGHDVWIARELLRRGLGVVLAEYRGYGLSQAEAGPTEQGLYADAHAVIEAVLARGVARDRMVLVGHSLGTGVATEMARRARYRAVALVSPYTSIVDMARRSAPPIFPVSLIVRDRFDTLSKAPNVDAPVLVVHGASDGFIPLPMGQRVCDAFPHCEMMVVQGGHHGDVMAVEPDRVFGGIVALSAPGRQ